jgi:hypothetical protein
MTRVYNPANTRMPDRDDITEQEIDILLDLRNSLMPAAKFDQIADVLRGAVTLAE